MKSVFFCLSFLALVPSCVFSFDLVADTTSLVLLLRGQQSLPAYKKSLISLPPYWSLARQAGTMYQVDPCLIVSIIKHESNYNPRAASVKGAEGLMQLMPQTASLMGVENSFNPKQNIYGGTRYLRDMLRRFHGDVYAALLAYNAGPTRVEARNIPSESHRYAASVLNYYKLLRRSL